MKKATKKTAPKTTRKSSRSSSPAGAHIIMFRRVFLITSCLVLTLMAAGTVAQKGVNQAVAGISVAKGLFAQTTVTLPRVDGAVSYNIYYKEVTEGKYTNAVRNIPASTTTYTISYLKKSNRYHYKISALNSAGKEFWWSNVTAAVTTGM